MNLQDASNMMNQGASTNTITALDQNSLEARQVTDSSQGYVGSYYTPSVDGRIVGNTNYLQDQRAELPTRNVQDGSAVPSIATSSSSAPVNVPQEYSSYTTYPNTDPYGYGNTSYAGYYNGYQQQSTQPYPQPVGAYQNTGAPYQPISSFQNTGSYAGPASYSSTYYNPGHYQTSGGHASSGYSSQTNSWNQGNYAPYASQQYPNYASDANGAYNASSVSATTSLTYEEHYKQWADYYSQTEVSCAPGTENVSVPSTTNPVCSAPSTSIHPGSYSQPPVPQPPAPQPPAPSISSWRPDSNLSESPSVQNGSVISSGHDSYWKNAAPTFQNHNVTPQQPQFQQVDPNPTYQTFQEQQKAAYLHVPTVQYHASHQVSQSFPPVQNAPPFDSRRVSALPIPTNPRIAPNFPLGVPKTNKDSSTTITAAKPAYVSVSLPKANEKVLPGVAADSIKPETFPKSLRGYVERALARCKDDSQMVACQAVMKEIITKATADGTLYTRDWDIEPLFPLPAVDMTNKDNLQPATPISLLSKNKRSPGRRSKSRWEPVSEEKPVPVTPPVSVDSVKFGGGWMHFSGKDTKLLGGRLEGRDSSSNMKFQLPESRNGNKSGSNPAKRQRRTDALGTDGAVADDVSSDSDKEQSLTAYYSAAIALADSPEEKKRRENRSKRFDRGPGNRKNSSMRPKNVGAGNLYTRRASALVLSKNFEDGSSRAVEDIDWDALTVKGTCQEIEKRYLRLTSAPDPATVRPEEVLEKALLMVQNSQKNYLYKCDQLKSIRQDLTVQRIRNELTAKVYETHARFAIEVGDMSEINQCQSQLQTLYAEGIKGCHMEFAAYNLLSVILHSNNNRDLLSAMSRLSVDTRKDESVKHALAVRAAVTSGNYVTFFRLYKTAPNLNTCLMDLYVEKMRYKAVTCMSRSYRPTVPVPYIARVLGFTNALPTGETSEDKDSDVLEECTEWLKAHGACLVADSCGEMQLDAKASSSTLFMPEPEDAVAHGDASLAVNDFLTRNPSS